MDLSLLIEIGMNNHEDRIRNNIYLTLYYSNLQ